MAKKGTYSIYKHPSQSLYFLDYNSKSVGRTEGTYSSLSEARKKMNKLLDRKYN